LLTVIVYALEAAMPPKYAPPHALVVTVLVKPVFERTTVAPGTAAPFESRAETSSEFVVGATRYSDVSALVPGAIVYGGALQTSAVS
jgi:hypothetical protein